MAVLRTHRLLFVSLLLALLIWLPRGLALDHFVTADEHAWLARSGNFYRALTLGDFASTFQRHHPGVTTTWAGLAGFLTAYPAYAREAPSYFGWLTEEIEPFLRSQGHDPLELLAAGRAFVVIAVTASLVAAFVLAARMLDSWTALLCFALLAFSPFHVAHSRLLHLDGLVSSFMFLAVVAYLAYLHERRWWALVFSAVAAGLAFLTRSPALFLVPYVALISAGWWILNRNSDGKWVSPWPIVWALLLWALMGGLTFVLLWPAMWVDPLGSIKQVLAAASAYAAEGHLKPTFYRGEVFAGDPGFDFYPVTYLWRTTPVVLAGLLLALLSAVTRTEPFNRKSVRALLAALVLYALGFLLFISMGAKKFDRYLLPIYPALCVVAGAGYAAIGAWSAKLFRSSLEHWVQPALLAVVIVAQASFAMPTFPYYLSYYNPIMGGSASAARVMMIGWGEGADEAARYLNLQDGASQATAASGYTNGPFSYFFDGLTVPIYFRHVAEYAVVFAQDWQRQLPSRRAIAYYDQHEADHVVTLNGIDYAHIYDLRTLPMPDYVTEWDHAIRLASYQLPAAAISPGDSFRAIFYFVNLAPIDHNLNVIVRIVGPDGQEIARSEGWPWGAATSGWQQDEVWPDGHELAIPSATAQGWYRVDVGFYDPETQELLDATEATTGEPAGDLIALDYIRVGDPPVRPKRALSPSPVLGSLFRLTGADWQDDEGADVDIGRSAVHPGQTLVVTPFWESLKLTDVDYTAFFHVVGPDGSVLVQSDRQPLNGFMPTSTWIPGQIVNDAVTLQIPDDAMPGTYTAYTGMYDLMTMERLPVTVDGVPAGDAFPIARLTVQ